MRFPLLSTFLVLSLVVSGCAPQAAPPAAPAKAPAAHDHADAAHSHDHDGHDHAGHDHGPGHEHGEGPHHGTLADWGGGKYHVEFVVDHAKKEATVYVLGSDEKTPAPVKTTDGTLLLTITEPSMQVTLKAAPLEGEADGASSRYVGTDDGLAAERTFAGSISAEVDGTPYAGDFKEDSHAGHDHK
jgi:hypothetical protein